MTARRIRRPAGALWRFVRALIVLVVVVVGLPALLTLFARVGLDAWHPLPEIGSAEDVTGYLDRQLSATEIAPIAMRTLLVVAWLLWAGMVVSIVAAVLAARGGRPRRRRLPEFALFSGLAHWIAAGLTALTSTAPGFVSAPALASPRPYTISVASSSVGPFVEAPVPDGYGRVQRGESIETFAQRTLGDAARWSEVWELNRDAAVGSNGERWTQAWRIEPGWDLRLPAVENSNTVPPPVAQPSSAPPRPSATLAGAVASSWRQAPATPPTGGSATHQVVAGESYWSIAEATLGDGATGTQVYAYVQALIDHNAPRLGYGDPAMLQPGDAVELVERPAPPANPAQPASMPHVVVEPGDSYWAIAEDQLGDASPSEVLALTEDLMALNNPILAAGDPDGSRNYDDDRRMIHPGDVVYLADPNAPAAPPPPPAPLLPPAPPATPAPPPQPTHGERLEAMRVVDAIGDVATAARGTAAAVNAAAAAPPPPAEAPSDDADDDALFTAPCLLALTGIAAAGVGAVFAQRRRAAARVRPHQRPAGLPGELHEAARELLGADVADVEWLGMELRWLAQHCPAPLRASLRIEELQIGSGRDLEVAFSTTPLDAPPEGWTMVAERIWHLDRQHTVDELAAYGDLPPLLPALVTLGEFEGGNLYVNLENHRGVNVTGDEQLVAEWVTGVVWEVGSGGVAEHPTVLLVGVEIEGVDELGTVKVMDEAAALEWFSSPPPPTEPSMFDLRANAWDGWDTTLVVLAPGVDAKAWAETAARADVGVVAIDGELAGGLTVVCADGRVDVPAWDLNAGAVGVDAETANLAADLLAAASAPPVIDELVIPVLTADAPPSGNDDAVTPTNNGDSASAAPSDTAPSANGDRAAANGDSPAPAVSAEEVDAPGVDVDEGWAPPSWPVTVRLLGVPAVTDSDGEALRLPPQPLAALAYLAINRRASVDEFWAAIWGEKKNIKPQRVRDLLSVMRTSAGGDSVVPHLEDRVVRAGPELGCDLDVFDALVERAAKHPHEALRRLDEALALADGRPFNYQEGVAQHWRWADLGHLHSVWGARVATAAYELAQHHLAGGDPQQAIAVARRGLRADPLSEKLTEVLIAAFAASGAIETAQLVFEAHDRAMAEGGFGGASEETRKVIERLRAAHRSSTAGHADAAAAAG